MFQYVPCIPNLSRTFIMEGCWIFSKVVSASKERIICFIPHMISLFIWWVTLTDFHIFNNPWVSGVTPTWSQWMIFLMCSWVWFASILLNIFCMCVFKGNWYVNFFLYCILVWFEYQGNLIDWTETEAYCSGHWIV